MTERLPASGWAGGYGFVFGPCWSCGTLFTFDADRVPSIPVDPETGRALDLDEHGREVEVDPDARARAVNRPICAGCIAIANQNRAAAGRPLIDVLPGAYPFDE